ncbi:MAG: DUF975 family protein [Ruminococcaceae bacterium]|nr:DUF975 family protein [Oscillospiraceae bacterium]
MTRQQMKLEAKQALKGNLGVAIGIYIVYGVIVAALSSIGVGGFFVGLFAYGIMVAFLAMARTNKLEFTDLFSGFNNFGTVFGATLLKAIYTVLWTLLFFIPGFVKSYSYAMTEYILADEPDLKCNEAITKSRKMMNGHKMELFILDLSFIGWAFLCALTLGILTFYVTPYMLTTRAKFYENLKANYVEEKN